MSGDQKNSEVLTVFLDEDPGSVEALLALAASALAANEAEVLSFPQAGSQAAVVDNGGFEFGLTLVQAPAPEGGYSAINREQSALNNDLKGHVAHLSIFPMGVTEGGFDEFLNRCSAINLVEVLAGFMKIRMVHHGATAQAFGADAWLPAAAGIGTFIDRIVDEDDQEKKGLYDTVVSSLFVALIPFGTAESAGCMTSGMASFSEHEFVLEPAEGQTPDQAYERLAKFCRYGFSGGEQGLLGEMVHLPVGHFISGKIDNDKLTISHLGLA